MRVLVVGCGSIGRRHARLLRARRDVDVALCDVLEVNRLEAAEHAGCSETYGSLEEALARGFQACVVATPNDTHAPVAAAAMRAGLDVLLEKPMADTAAEAAPIAEAARETGRVVMVAYNMRQHPALREVKRLITEGAIGTPVGGRAMVGSYFTLMCARTPFRLSQPGVLVVDASHEIDFLRWLLGDVALAYARAASSGDLEMKPRPNLVSAVLEFRSGALVGLHMDYVQHPQRRAMEVFGDRGTLTLDFETSTLEIFSRDLPGRRVQHFPCHRDQFYADEHEAFFEACRTRRSPIPPEDGLATLRVCEAILESARSNVPVAL